MNEDRFEDLLSEAAREYHRPPETPRERMWSRIEAARQRRGGRVGRLGRGLRSPWVRWGLGLAAALAIGIGLGRISLREVAEPVGMADAGREIAEPGSGGAELMGEGRGSGSAGATNLVYEMLSTQHLTRAEALLTSFRSDPRTVVEADGEFRSRADELLTSTRLLLDSPVADDPLMSTLLEDLEIVLVQIRQLSASSGDAAREIELISDGLQRRQVLFKLRSRIPAGPDVLQTTGAL